MPPCLRHALICLLLPAVASCASGPRGVSLPPVSSQPGEPPPGPSLWTPGLAVVGTDSGLELVSRSGAARGTPVKGDVSWCAVDNKAQAVWYLARGGGQRRLGVLDLVAGRDETVAAPVPAVDRVIIDHGRAELGGGNPVAFHLALLVQLEPPPRLEPRLGCEGDAAVYCYKEQGQQAPQERRGAQLNDQLRARKEALQRLRPRRTALLLQLGRRGLRRELWSPPPPARALPRVPVDSAACEAIPSACGSVRLVFGTHLWLVVTANSRGDYFHQAWQLYDPRAKQFVDPRRSPPRRSSAPLKDPPPLDGMLVSPSGEAYTRGGQVVSFGKGTVYQGANVACGWIGGGWKMSGLGT